MTRSSPLPGLARIGRGLRREFLQRRLPHGLLGPAYLWPTHDARIRLHRRFWWNSNPRWPRLAWLIVEAWLWLRWVGLHALPACWRTLRRFGPAVEAAEGIPRRIQAWRVLKLALRWCIPPGESYRFGLYREPAKALDYVYDSESAAYHAWRSEALGCAPASLGLLQDKSRFMAAMAKQGIPVVPHLACVIGNSHDLAPLIDGLEKAGCVFCKMNGGNQGRGAFAAWSTPEGMAGRSFSGQPLPDTGAVAAAWRALLKLDTALVQPCLENHPDLAPLAFNDDAITVRCISQWADGGPGRPPTQLACLSATLEAPAGQAEGGQTFYAILPIQPETGELGAPIKAAFANPAMREAVSRVEAAARAVKALPDWAQLMAASYAAHCLFPDVRAIAWDWVITPAGPVLLEGNTGWGCATPQILAGGFLEPSER